MIKGQQRKKAFKVVKKLLRKPFLFCARVSCMEFYKYGPEIRLSSSDA